jgi:hypothetical protein
MKLTREKSKVKKLEKRVKALEELLLQDDVNIEELKAQQPTEKHESYDMCKDQLAQIDCRNISCIFYKGSGTCSNISPALTIINDKVTCWSKKESQQPTEEYVPMLGDVCEVVANVNNDDKIQIGDKVIIGMLDLLDIGMDVSLTFLSETHDNIWTSSKNLKLISRHQYFEK